MKLQKNSSRLSPGRLLLQLLQGALIGLGSVLPGISGGVLSVVFGIYKPLMELLANPLSRLKTHVPKLLPYLAGAAIGFMGVANLLAYFLEKYPAPSVCLFVGLITGMLPSLWQEGTQQGLLLFPDHCYGTCLLHSDRTKQFLYHDCTKLYLVSVLRLLPCLKRNRSRHELFYSADATWIVHSFCGRHRPFVHGGFDPCRNRRPDHHHLPLQGC